MGYQRGERGRLASLVTVVILGTAVLSIDHISGRSIRPPARSEAANQVVSMNLAPGSLSDLSASVRSDLAADTSKRCQHGSRLKTASTRDRCPDISPATNAIMLKARAAKDIELPVFARITEATKKPCFLELKVDSIPPLEKRLIASASQMSSIKSVSIRIDGEVRINKTPIPVPASVYLIRASAERINKARDRSFKSEVVAPASVPGWKCPRPTS